MEQPITTFRVMSCYDDALTSYETTSRNVFEFVHQNFGWGEHSLFLDGSSSKIGIKNNNSGWYRAGIFNANYSRYSSSSYKSNNRDDYKEANKMLIVK